MRTIDRTIDRLFSWLKRATTYPSKEEVFWDGVGNTTASGERVDEESALKYTAFWGAVNRISNDVGKLPFSVLRRLPGDSGFEKARDLPVYKLVHDRPNSYQTPYIFKQSMESALLRWGNGYAEIVRGTDGRPIELHPINPGWVSLDVAADGKSFSYLVKPPNMRAFKLSLMDMLHIRGLGDGIIAPSPVRLFAESIGLGLGAERTGSAFFGNMMRPGGNLEHPAKLSDEAYARLKKSMERNNSGSGNAGKVMILEEGMKFTALSIPPNDAQFLETRVHQVQDIARIFNMPPHKIAELSNATFSNIEEQSQEYVVDCLQPHLTNWEQECNAKLLMDAERETLEFKFSVEGLLRGNSQARAEFYNKLFQIGVMSINEIRGLENLPSIGEPGNVHYVPLNMTTAEDAMTPDEPEPTVIPADDEPEDEDIEDAEA